MSDEGTPWHATSKHITIIHKFIVFYSLRVSLAFNVKLGEKIFDAWNDLLNIVATVGKLHGEMTRTSYHTLQSQAAPPTHRKPGTIVNISGRANCTRCNETNEWMNE